MLKKHIKNHIFEYLVEMVTTILYTIILLYLCGAKDIALGILFSIAYSLGRTVSEVKRYKKEYIDVK